MRKVLLDSVRKNMKNKETIRVSNKINDINIS